jgi:hypothetical protein
MTTLAWALALAVQVKPNLLAIYSLPRMHTASTALWISLVS